MDLATLHWHQARMVLATCAADVASPLTDTQKRSVFLKLLDHTWRPTVDTCPVPFATVEAWWATVRPGTAGWAKQHPGPYGTLSATYKEGR